MKKIKEFWASLEGVTEISKRELFLGLASCTLTGIVLGIIFTPHRTFMVGNNNGNNGCTGFQDDMQDED